MWKFDSKMRKYGSIFSGVSFVKPFIIFVVVWWRWSSAYFLSSESNSILFWLKSSMRLLRNSISLSEWDSFARLTFALSTTSLNGLYIFFESSFIRKYSNSSIINAVNDIENIMNFIKDVDMTGVQCFAILDNSSKL
mgnify:CR=1 FL=1